MRVGKRADQKPYAKHILPRRIPFFIYELAPACIVLAVPLIVHAGFFSPVMDLFTEEAAAESATPIVSYSAQHTALLSATINPDPLSAIGGGDISYDDQALISSGPVSKDEVEASPMNRGEISVYTVQEGDSLSQIAEMYGVTTNTIMWANDITKAKGIHEGDVLVILPIVGVRHTVAKGESLGSIVEEYGANLEEVLEYNNLASADDLVVGSELIIPGGEMHTENEGVAHTVTPTKSSGGSSSGSGFTHPLPGAIRTQGIHGYNGVDLAASAGTPIRAAAAGTVIVAKSGGWNGGYGSYVVIKHQNTQTLYAHLSSVSVGVGQSVTAGESIGIIGNTGKSTGTHLHFEVRGGINPF